MLYAAFTLYETRGDQIKRYGYPAFGLTVGPYLVMSLVNLINSILTPNYVAVYLVKTEVMAEAASLCPIFAGVTYERLEGYKSLQWPVHEDGTDEPLLFTKKFPFPDGKYSCQRSCLPVWARSGQQSLITGLSLTGP